MFLGNAKILREAEMRRRTLSAVVSVVLFCVSVVGVAPCHANGDQSKILRLYSAVNSAASRKAVCIHTGTARCDSDFDYCMKPIEGPDGKIAHALQICLSRNVICDDNCQADYNECRDGGTSPGVCYEEYVKCDTTCENVYITCQRDAVTAQYEPPDLFRCTTYRDVCVESVVQRCSK